ncbi:hypothetical protein BsWGS_28650 [Bradybaena similaris]
MTIIYQYRVATTSLGGFLKLLKAWKGSVYKLLYKELIIFVSLYSLISIIYRFALTGDNRRIFEGIVLELYSSTSAIPLSFLLGFYVTFIAQRWWQQFTNVPWPDRTLFSMTTYLHGFDDRARMMRRSVARYMMFGLIWICRGISVSVMKRFPTLDHIVDAGFITKEEKAMFENTECKYQKFFVPLSWANQILVTARRENIIDTDFGLRMILQPLADFRDRCSLCFVYDWITVPLVYTQVVTFAAYSYFAVSLFGQQYLDPDMKYKGFEEDFYFPGFTILQFLFYMGWLKVAEQMINPFGEDDDDFDINWLLDRHTTVAFTLVDQIYGKHPDFVKDGFWNETTPDVPYTESSARFIRPNFLGSTFNIARPSVDHDKLFIPEHENINQHDWSPRPRGKGSLTDSLLSLLHVRPLHHHSTGGSETTLTSSDGGQGHQMSNGRPYYMVDRDKVGEERMRRSSIDVPVTVDLSSHQEDEYIQLRERAHTDLDLGGRDMRGRKLSLPFSIQLFKSKQKRSEPLVASPKNSRFLVEPVKEDAVLSSDASMAAKLRRSAHQGVPFQNAVSRMPVLSAIEECCTITSLKQLVDPPTVTDFEEVDDDFVEPHESVVLSDDDKAYEDCISYVDETNGSVKNEDDAAFFEFASIPASSAAATSTPSLMKKSSVETPQTKTPTGGTAGFPASTETLRLSVPSSSKELPVSSSVPTAQTLGQSMRNSTLSSEQTLFPPAQCVDESYPLLQPSKKDNPSKNKQTKTDKESAPLILIEEC